MNTCDQDCRRLSLEIWYNRLLESGTKIKSSNSEYRILEHFGSSGNGEIFLAMTNNNFLVGLKIILQGCTKRNLTPLHVETEVETLRSATKKTEDILLPFLEYFILENEQDKYYVIVLKYFEGYIPLSSYLDKNLFHLEQKMKIQSVLKKHFETIHSKLHIAHQDVNVNNVLIHSKTMHVRFFDLGFSISRFGNSDEQILKFTHKDFDSIEKI